MFDTLKQKLRSLGAKRAMCAPSQFDDPVALRTEWTPKKPGGASFRTHNLVEVDCARMEFRASTGAWLFCLAFIVPGLGVLIGGLARAAESEGFHTVLASLFGLVFVGAGGAMLYFETAPIVFDKTNGWFWKGRKGPNEMADAKSAERSAPLASIHAIQLISEYVSGESSYYSYELNLVLDDGRRINVVDHGNKGRLREDAGRLALFLGKPVWDAI